MINLNISARGSKWWFCKTYLHRDNGPAVTEPNGYKVWFKYDKKHRTAGPAVVGKHIGQDEYWINGQELTEYEHMFMNEIDYD